MAAHEDRSGRTRLITATSVLALLFALLAGSAHAEVAAPAEIRVSGADRYETAAEVALAAFDDPGAVDTLVVASGADFADALAAAALAGAVDGPILLTRPGTLPDATAEAISALAPATAYIVGGSAAVSGAVETAVGDLGPDTVRLGGDDRFDTARLVAAHVVDDLGQPVGELDGQASAFVATGRVFADALAAGPAAYAAGLPILLTEATELPDATAQALADIGADRAVILGGTAAVSAGVEDALADLGLATDRIAGSDRSDTAARVAALTVADLGFEPANVGLATGADALGGADALVAAPYLGGSGTPLLLVTSLPEATAGYLHRNAAFVDALHVFGGTAAIPADTVGAAQDAVLNPQFEVPLSWINEVHVETGEFYAGEVDGTGHATLRFDRMAGELHYDLEVAVQGDIREGPAAAHIHIGALDENGPVVLPLTEPDDAGRSAGTLTDDDFSDAEPDLTLEGILADLDSFYVNVHTEQHPPGAVRGQLPDGGQLAVASQPVTFTVELSWRNEVDPETGAFGAGEEDATGSAVLDIDPLAGTIDYDIAVDVTGDLLEGPGAHIHVGRIDENGPIVVFFDHPDADGTSVGTLSEDDFADDFADLTLVDLLLDPGNFYVNVHTAEHPAGAVRGQLPDGGQTRLPEGDGAVDPGPGLYAQ